MKEIFLLAIMFRTIWTYLRSFCSNLQFRHSHLCDIIPRPVSLLQQEGAQSQVRVTHKQKLAFCVLKIIIIKDNPHNSFENLVSAHLIILSRSQSLLRTLAQLSNFWPALSSITITITNQPSPVKVGDASVPAASVGRLRDDWYFVIDGWSDSGRLRDYCAMCSWLLLVVYINRIVIELNEIWLQLQFILKF